MPEIKLNMPAQNIANFLAYVIVLYHLLHVSSYIAANLQQICCMKIIFSKIEIISYSRIVLCTFPENLAWFYQ